MRIGARTARVTAVGAALVSGSGCLDRPSDDKACDTPWYVDGDGDGAGAGEPVTACDPPQGNVAAGGDCDDTDPEVHPGAAEVCGLVDDDCDGLVDDADPDVDPSAGGTWYEDADGDGFGDPETATMACAEPPGWTTDGTDCDDTSAAIAPVDGDLDGVTACDGDCADSDPAVYPGAPEEECGPDLDCDPSSEVRFGAPVALPIDASGGLRSADIDLDGHPDLLLAALAADTVAWYPNLGDGTFGPQQYLPVPALSGPQDAFPVDLDGDGDPDVVVGSVLTDRLGWYENLGGGSFGPEQLLAEVSDAVSIHPADLDGDGDLDVTFLANGPLAGGDLVAYWWENPGGTVHEIGTVTEQRVGYIEVADLDLDGDVDVVGGEYLDGPVGWFANLGGGTFDAGTILGDGRFVGDLAVADVDLDGLPDVLTTFTVDDTVVWYRNLGGGTFDVETVVSATLDGVADIAAVDLDRDGDDDLAANLTLPDQVVWLENLGGTFAAEQVLDPACDAPGNVLATDLFGDGLPDLAVTCLVEGVIRVYPSACD